ncbi:hypothetical protein LAZ67_9000609 [Cordylochernes scorpioides]|uniref:Uncharacterized protein n=1 Tax=Cordylochernes scorpioides TaxID=51811 RepID=A0ABY6KXL9_9ARAC|nr:hypothetical protein LAZ67_9000609 [Cordylochernes scorpioides]
MGIKGAMVRDMTFGNLKERFAHPTYSLEDVGDILSKSLDRLAVALADVSGPGWYCSNLLKVYVWDPCASYQSKDLLIDSYSKKILGNVFRIYVKHKQQRSTSDMSQVIAETTHSALPLPVEIRRWLVAVDCHFVWWLVPETCRSKRLAKFIPRFLTNEKKLCRLATCEDMLEMTRTDPEWKDKIITGNETWVYGYDPETKRQSAEWRGQGEPKPKISRI